MARAFEAVARYLQLPAEDVEGISGYSVRVGATQDLLAECGFGVGDAGGTLEVGPDADAVQRACHGVAGRYG